MCNYILTWITNDTLIRWDQLYVPNYNAHVNNPFRCLADGSRINYAQLKINHSDKTLKQTTVQWQMCLLYQLLHLGFTQQTIGAVIWWLFSSIIPGLLSHVNITQRSQIFLSEVVVLTNACKQRSVTGKWHFTIASICYSPGRTLGTRTQLKVSFPWWHTH